MENFYFQKGSSLRNTGLFIIFFFLCAQSFGQRGTNINENGVIHSSEISKEKRESNRFFDPAKRAREFRLNPSVKQHHGLQKGSQVRLQLFEDRDFISSVTARKTDINGITSLTLKLEEYDFAYAYVILSENSYFMTVDIPELHEKYTTRTDINSGKEYLFLLDNSKIEVPGCGQGNAEGREKGMGPLEKKFPGPGTGPGPQHDPAPQPDAGTAIFSESEVSGSCSLSDAGSTNIDLMVVYTSGAATGAGIMAGGIKNIISGAIAEANTVVTNSGLDFTFSLVHSAQVNFSEATPGSALGFLIDPNDGVMDEVHQLRNDSGADMVMLLTTSEGANFAGVARLLINKSGSREEAFSQVVVDYAIGHYTFVHELGHNLGASHNKDQNVQPGPTIWRDWAENTWSGGWRWRSSDNNLYCSVMTYEDGFYYSDNQNAIKVPYFSDPAHIYLGGKAGDEIYGNNALTLRSTSKTVAAYSEIFPYCLAAGGMESQIFIDKVVLGQMENLSDVGRYTDFGAMGTCLAPQELIQLQVQVTGINEENKVQAWVDWNDDKVFDPVTELIADKEVSIGLVSQEFTAPIGTAPGRKRLRIRVSQRGSGVSSPCRIETLGEVEDYTIYVNESIPCNSASVPQGLMATGLKDNSVDLLWQPVSGISGYTISYRKEGTIEWTSISGVKFPFYKLNNLDPETIYEVRIGSTCSGAASDLSIPIRFTTDAAAAQMVFVDAPVAGEAGNYIEPIRVELREADGSLSSSADEIKLSLVDEAGTGAILSGILSSSAENGSVVFDKVFIDKEGSFAIKANSGLLEVMSAPITIGVFNPTTFVVNTTSDLGDVDLSDPFCADPNGNCSLRAAIQNANKTQGKDLIHFNIEGSGPHTISLTKGLPAITAPVVLDATTQPGYSFENSLIVLEGSVFEKEEAYSVYGLALIGNSSGSVIKGFCFGGFATYSVAPLYAWGTDGHTIVGNKFGTSPDGKQRFENYYGIYLEDSDNNIIGGVSAEERNIFSGNIAALNLDNSNQNSIINNYIGVNISANDTISNVRGIRTVIDKRKTYQGALYYSSSNLVSGNIVGGNDRGIILGGDLNRIESNFIGIDPTGQYTFPNYTGLQLYGSDNIVGGEGKGNVISGNYYGLTLREAINTTVSSNIIGTDPGGKYAVPNTLGIAITRGSPSNVIENNLVSGNSEFGIYIETKNTLVIGNKIGTSADGSSAIPNKIGISLVYGANNNFIGKTGAGNVIFGNQEGIRISEAFSNKIVGNTIASNNLNGVNVTNDSYMNLISMNSFISNSGLGIDLGADGATSNDNGDRDRGANLGLNYPEMKNEALLEGQVLKINYRLTSDANTAAFLITVEFYKDDGNGQGREYLGSDLYAESDISKGKNTKAARIPLLSGNSLNGGDQIVAISVDADGNTSEFSGSISVTGGCTMSIYYADSDGDGYGDPSISEQSCSPSEGFVENDDDCDDRDPSKGAGIIWYADVDGDGFGIDSEATNMVACEAQPGFVDIAGDCDDGNASAHPGGTEVADDGIDQDCDGADLVTNAVDTDEDGIADQIDNCPEAANSDQADADSNGIGDVCQDSDGDGVLDITDNCPAQSNPDQLDTDGDGTGDLCDSPSACEITTALTVTDCSVGSQINWSIYNPGTCEVVVNWELRKQNSSGVVTIPPGSSVTITTGDTQKGKSQLVLSWWDSNNVEYKTSTNASGTSCPSAGVFSDPVAVEPFVYPNPISEEGIWLSFPAELGGRNFNASIHDVNGHLLLNRTFIVGDSGGEVFWNFDHGSWDQGIYFLLLKSGGSEYHLQLIKD